MKDVYEIFDNKEVPRGALEIKDVIFFGGDRCLEKCYKLHQKMERAFTLNGGMQQPPRPCDPEESCKIYEKECAEGKAEVLIIATEIVKGLLGKDYMIAKKE